MKNLKALNIAIAVALTGVASSAAYGSALDDLARAISDGKTDLNFRYRYEIVDQDGIENNANASTLKSRLTWQSDATKAFFAKFEIDNVSYIGNDSFNNTQNGNTTYPVVADPKGTDVNQAYFGYKTDKSLVTFGRQRIVHNDQRFVGGVAWRQNEQTFDGVRLQYNSTPELKFDYSYVYNINRIFGPNGDKADLDGHFHLFNSNYKVNKEHSVKFFGYHLDFEDAIALSSRTFGLAYDGKVAGFKLHASAATQSDAGDNPTDYSANFMALEVGKSISNVNLAIGFQSLGADNGKGFSTPLATLHKFQGFADKFLATPGTGINDLYLKASTKIDKLTLAATWHDFSADEGSADYGTEINLVAKYPLHKRLGLLVKYANYSADDVATDTSKFWTMLNFKF